MAKVLLVFLTVIIHCTTTAAQGCKTEWFDIDDPSGDGDSEVINLIRIQFPNGICLHPTACEVETTSGVPASQTGENVQLCSITAGFTCVNNEQSDQSCQDYRIRFTCPASFCAAPPTPDTSKICKTEWFNIDDPSGEGDYENFHDLYLKFPKRLCLYPSACEVETTSGVPASQTEDVVEPCNVARGFFCKNTDQSDQSCEDYRIRFTCPKSFCNAFTMTTGTTSTTTTGASSTTVSSTTSSTTPGTSSTTAPSTASTTTPGSSSTAAPSTASTTTPGSSSTAAPSEYIPQILNIANFNCGSKAPSNNILSSLKSFLDSNSLERESTASTTAPGSSSTAAPSTAPTTTPGSSSTAAPSTAPTTTTSSSSTAAPSTAPTTTTSSSSTAAPSTAPTTTTSSSSTAAPSTAPTTTTSSSSTAAPSTAPTTTTSSSSTAAPSTAPTTTTSSSSTAVPSEYILQILNVANFNCSIRQHQEFFDLNNLERESTATTTTPGSSSTAAPSSSSTAVPSEYILQILNIANFNCSIGQHQEFFDLNNLERESTAPTTTAGANSTTASSNACKTEWFDRDNYSGQGICEDLTSLQKAFPYRICNHPITCEVETASGFPSSQTGEDICRCDIATGFYCVYTEKSDGKCKDYRVRFTCTESI
ncbi:mucin-2-like [Hypanus sabinus]|uniref:mucin-2-like n=1 Tax=Hypanus sabinus TaxID=79690 RepID=UPI0028C385CE|nr:mucin-2-like [Hypanus sabinus]